MNKLPQTGLLIPLSEITSRSTEEDHIRHIGALGRLDHLGRDIDLVPTSWRDQAESVGFGVSDVGGDVLQTAWSMRDDGGA
jgi:hypothetical protein